jgi:hypothetical protein
MWDASDNELRRVIRKSVRKDFRALAYGILVTRRNQRRK